MKSEPLAKARIDIITHLMDAALRPQVDATVVMAVLDVRTHHLITPTVPIPAIHAGLIAEMAYISALWPSV